MNQQQVLAKELIACEPVTPALRDKYQRQVTAILERSLGTAARAIWVFWTAFGIAQVALFGYTAVWSFGDIPVWGTLLFAMAGVFGLAFSVASGWIAYSGRVLLKIQPPLISGLAWTLVVFVLAVLMVAAPHSLGGLRAITCALAFLVLGAVVLLSSRTEQAELRNREKLLEIEYQLADLADRLPKTVDE